MTAAIDVVLYLPTIAVHWAPCVVVGGLLAAWVWPWVREVAL